MQQAAEDLPWLARHWSAIDSDMSRFHRVDDAEGMRMATLMQRVRHLPAYGGALMISMAGEQRTAAQASTIRTQPVDNTQRGGFGAHAEQDTPDEVVAAKWAAALMAQYPPELAAGGIEMVSDTEMERMLKS